MLHRLVNLAERGDDESLRVMTLQLTDMFIAAKYEASSQERNNFDFIVGHAVSTVGGVLVERLSERLAHTKRVSEKTALRFAEHDDIAIAGPVLSASPVLTDGSLIKIAKVKSEEHRVAIASRPTVSEPVSEVLTEMGGERTLDKVAANSGANFNVPGMTNLLDRSSQGSNAHKSIVGRTKDDSALARTVRASLSKDLRRKLEPLGLQITSAEFEAVNQHAKLEAEQAVRADRLSQVEAMVALAKINSDQSNVDQAVARALEENNFLGAIRIIGLDFKIGYEYLINAMEHENETPLALMAKAANLSSTTYANLESARCDYFGHALGNIELKTAEAETLEKTDASNMLEAIRNNIAAHEAANAAV